MATRRTAPNPASQWARRWAAFTWVQDGQRIGPLPITFTLLNWLLTIAAGIAWWQLWRTPTTPGIITGVFLLWTIARAAIVIPAHTKTIRSLYTAARTSSRLPALTRTSPEPDPNLIGVARWHNRNTPARGQLTYTAGSQAAQIGTRSLAEKDIEKARPAPKGKAWVFDWTQPGQMVFLCVPEDDPRVQQRATRVWIDQVLAKLFPRVPDLNIDIEWADPATAGRPDIPATITIAYGATITADIPFRLNVEDQFDSQVDRGVEWLYDWSIGTCTITGSPKDSDDAAAKRLRRSWLRDINVRAKDAFGFRNVGQIDLQITDWETYGHVPKQMHITFEGASLDQGGTTPFLTALDARLTRDWPHLCWLDDWKFGYANSATLNAVPNTDQMAYRKNEERRLREVASSKFKVPRGSAPVNVEVLDWRSIYFDPANTVLGEGEAAPEPGTLIGEKPTRVVITFGTLDVNDYNFQMGAERQLDSLYPDTGWNYRWDSAKGQCTLVEVPALPRAILFPDPGTPEFERLAAEALQGKMIYGPAKGGGDAFTDFREVPHAIIGGNTGRGKSVVIRIPILWGLWFPDRYDLYVCDPKRTDFTWTVQYPNVTFAATTEEIAAVVRKAHAQMEANQDLLQRHGVEKIDVLYDMAAKGTFDPALLPRRTVLIFDEIAAYLSPSSNEEVLVLQKESRNLLESLMMLARAAWVNVMGAAQKPDAASPGTKIRELMGNKIGVGWMKANMSEQVLGSNLASTLDRREAPKGRAWFIVEGEDDKLAQTYYLPLRTETIPWLPGSPTVQGLQDMIADRLTSLGYAKVLVDGAGGALFNYRWVKPSQVQIEGEAADAPTTEQEPVGPPPVPVTPPTEVVPVELADDDPWLAAGDDLGLPSDDELRQLMEEPPGAGS